MKTYHTLRVQSSGAGFTLRLFEKPSTAGLELLHLRLDAEEAALLRAYLDRSPTPEAVNLLVTVEDGRLG